MSIPSQHTSVVADSVVCRLFCYLADDRCCSTHQRRSGGARARTAYCRDRRPSTCKSI